jgi:hypothetical protein
MRAPGISVIVAGDGGDLPGRIAGTEAEADVAVGIGVDVGQVMGDRAN